METLGRALVLLSLAACGGTTGDAQSTTVAEQTSSQPSTTATPTEAPAAASEPVAQDPASTSLLVPTVVGTRLSYRGRSRGRTWDWNCTMSVIDEAASLHQCLPHADVFNYVTRAGFRCDESGLIVRGEHMAELGDAPEPVRAVAWPVVPGARAEVPGVIGRAVYEVVGEERIDVPAGSFDTWHVRISNGIDADGAVWFAPGTGIVRILLPMGRIDELVSIEAPAPTP